MSVGSNPAGMAPKVASHVAHTQAAKSANQANAQARSGQSVNINAPQAASAPAPAVATPGAPVATQIGATTTPAGRAAAPAQTAPQGIPAASFPGAMAAMFNQGLAALATVVVGEKNKTSKDESVDRAKSTQSDDKNALALKDSKSETGNDGGDISAANSAGGPST